MAPSATQSLGRRAEEHAQRHLECCGLHCLFRNFSCRGGEIDLVMLDGPCLVFVEVRYRRRNSRVFAAHTVGPRKQVRIIRAAKYFLQNNPRFRECVMRFDVVGIDAQPDGRVSTNWIRDAFRPGS